MLKLDTSYTVSSVFGTPPNHHHFPFPRPFSLLTSSRERNFIDVEAGNGWCAEKVEVVSRCFLVWWRDCELSVGKYSEVIERCVGEIRDYCDGWA
jgi:hypothetical protein